MDETLSGGGINVKATMVLMQTPATIDDTGRLGARVRRDLTLEPRLRFSADACVVGSWPAYFRSSWASFPDLAPERSRHLYGSGLDIDGKQTDAVSASQGRL